MRRAAGVGRSRPWAAHLVAAACFVLLAGVGSAQEGFVFESPPAEDSIAALNAPLFASHETLHLRIEAPIRRLKGDRGDDPEEHPGRLRVMAPSADATDLPVKIRTRGNFRLKRSTCDFPPLRLDFPKDSLAGTVFDGENRLKLVAHCRDNDRFEQIALQEYLIYRMHNLVTDKSFRVRLARVRYVDVERGDSLTHYGFLIEDDDRMAARNGMVVLDEEGIGPEALDPNHLVQMALFHYMIGNTDWSAGPTRHNVDLIVDERQVPIAVPFDFDWSGLISAPYAKPDPSLGIRNVRDRLFFLGCLEIDQLQPYMEGLRGLRGAFEELVRTQEGLDDKTAEEVLKYLGGFYDIIDDPRRASRELTRRC